MISKTKVAILGLGTVGTTLAYYLITKRISNEILLINRNKSKAQAEALDLFHSLGYSNSNTKITVRDYSDIKDADILVITVSPPVTPGINRLKLLDGTIDIMNTILPQIKMSGFNGFIIVVSNPVDLITRYIMEYLNYPKEKIIGTGTALDSARLRTYIAGVVGVEPRAVDAFVIGEHGDSSVVAWSQVSIGGKRLKDVRTDNKDYDELLSDKKIECNVLNIAYEISRNKGSTCYGIASIVGQIIKAILLDENKVMPVSCYLEGEYGVRGLCAGIPAVINSSGIKETVNLHLTDSEVQNFKASCEILEKSYNKLKETHE